MNHRGLDSSPPFFTSGLVAPTVLLAVLITIFCGAALVPREGTMLAGIDARALFYPWLSELREAFWNGHLPLWDPDHFGGTPLLANPQLAAAYPPTWLAIVLPVGVALGIHAALHLWVAGTGMLVLAYRLYGHRAAAIAAALTFTFSAFMGARLYGGHLGVIAVYAWVPWLLAATIWSVRDGRWAGAVLAGVPLALAILAGHVTSLIYLGMIWGGFALALAGRAGAWRVTRQVAISSVTGMALGAVQLIPFSELAWRSGRLTSTAFEQVYPMPLRHFITLLVPDFFGDPIRMNYWATFNFEEFFYGVGLLPLLSLPLAWRARAPFTGYCFLLIGAGIALSPGPVSPIYDGAAAMLPVIPFDRVPARAMVLFTFGASLLLSGVVAATRREHDDPLVPRVLRGTAAAVVLVAAAGLLTVGIGLQDAPSESVRVMRTIRFLGWARVALLTILLAAAWSWMLGRKDTWVPGTLLLSLVVVDLWTFSYRLVRVTNIDPAPVWRDAASILEEDGVRVLPWRISFLDENDAALVGLRSTSGYNTLALASYESLTRSADPRAVIYDVAAAPYVVSSEPLDGFTQGDRALGLVRHQGSAWLYRRPGALADARLVYDIEVIDSASRTRERLNEASFDASRRVIVADGQGCRPGPAPPTSGSAVVLSTTPGHWEIATKSDAPALLVLAENAYPGWKVMVDGVSAPPLIAYSTFKAVCVPAGAHRVTWRFRPLSPVIGASVSLIAAICVLAAIRSRHSATLRAGLSQGAAGQTPQF